MIDQLNGSGIWLVCGVIVAFIAVACVIFMVRAWWAGKALGMDPVRLRRAVTSSATFSILPSVGILIGVLALSGSLGTPWPWLRLSVIGALHYETTVASGAAEMVTGSKLSAGTMTVEAFPTVALLMSVCIVSGMILATIFTKRYLNRLQAKNPGGQDLTKQSSGGFGDRAMIAMFIGLVSAYLGSYIGAFVSQKPDGVKEIAEGVEQVKYATARFSFLGDWTPLVAAAAAAAAMAVFLWLKEKKNVGWIENFAIAGSMLIGMLAAVLVSLLKGGRAV